MSAGTCREMNTRKCPTSYGVDGCAGKLCARFQSDDPGPWAADYPVWAAEAQAAQEAPVSELLKIPPAGFLSSIRVQLEQTGGRDPFAELRELHREGAAYGSGKRQCEHCAELCHSYEGLSCDEPDGAWPCPTIQILDAIQPNDAPMTALTQTREGGWYRSLLPSGELWCESSDPEDMRREGPNGVALTLQVTVTTITTTWEPYELPEGGNDA